MMNANKPVLRGGYKFVFVLFSIVVAYSTINPLLAQQDATKSTKDKPGELKAFEGYYQFQDDKNVYLQIMLKENHVVLKQLWDMKEITFEQKSALEFSHNDDGHIFPLKFTKDQNGEITQVLAFDKDLWIKIKNYKPVEKKEIQLTPEQIKAYEGKYKLDGNGEEAYLQFTPTGNSVVVKELWSGKEYTIVPESELVFFGKNAYYPVTFSKDAKGNVTQALIFNKDVWKKVKE